MLPPPILRASRETAERVNRRAPVLPGELVRHREGPVSGPAIHGGDRHAKAFGGLGGGERLVGVGT